MPVYLELDALSYLHTLIHEVEDLPCHRMGKDSVMWVEALQTNMITTTIMQIAAALFEAERRPHQIGGVAAL